MSTFPVDPGATDAWSRPGPGPTPSYSSAAVVEEPEGIDRAGGAAFAAGGGTEGRASNLRAAAEPKAMPSNATPRTVTAAERRRLPAQVDERQYRRNRLRRPSISTGLVIAAVERGGRNRRTPARKREAIVGSAWRVHRQT